MLTLAFWRGALERALKTVAQALISAIAVDQVGVLDLPWPALLSLAGTAGLLSLLTSVASVPFGPAGSPSLTDDQP